MRFWQKTYILTLLLFLFCLYAGVFSLAVYSFNKSAENKETLCRAEQNYIASSFERDYETMAGNGAGASPSLLMQSYGLQYADRNVKLCFINNGEIIYSSFDKTVSSTGTEKIADETTDAEGLILVSYDMENIVHRKIGSDRYILISSKICSGEYFMIYGRYAGDLDDDFRTLMITYAAVAAAVSAVLALVLLFVLKKLSVPLEKLKTATEKITAGDMSVSADESGKDEFASLAKSFNKMVGTVKSQMTELAEDAGRKQTLVENMAHEMRTPLTTIRGYAEYIEKAALSDEEKSEAAGNIISETDRLKKISEKILDTAFIRENTVEKSKVDTGALIKETAESLANKAKNKEVTLKTDVNETEINGDATLLSMMLYNLAENAINACDNRGEVTLGCKGNVLYVSDNGKGMTKDQLSHITEPFYRTDKSRSRADGGAGLGLSLCRQIALSHDANLFFRSEKGKGTTAEVLFKERETER